MLEGHIKSILALDFSPNGYHLATGSEDNTARVFDLRKRGTLAVLPGVCVGVGHPSSAARCLMGGRGTLAVLAGVWWVGGCGGWVWGWGWGKPTPLFAPGGVVCGGHRGSPHIPPSPLAPPPHSPPAPTPAGHTSLVSQVRFDPSDGAYLLTCGYDNLSKLWSGRRFKLVRTLAGHEGKVGGAVGPGGVRPRPRICTCTCVGVGVWKGVTLSAVGG